MACTFLARFKIKPEKEQEFVALVGRMEEISKHEPDTLDYQFFRLAEPDMFAVYERFTSEEGDLAHQQNPLNVALIDAMVACMNGGYVREYLYNV